MRRLGRNVWVLGIASLLTDVSSEMLYPIVPLFLTAVLRAPMTVVGLIEGLAECVASLLKVASGWASDRLPRRRPLVVSGYGLSAAAKPILALAGSWQVVMASRLLDRLGKGIRTSPRDAVLAASVPAGRRGEAFGLHRALDTAGAVVGPLLSILLLEVWLLSYRALFVAAAVPAALAVAALAWLREPRPAAPEGPRGAAPLNPELRRFLWVLGVFSLGNSTDAFVLLRARDLGLSTAALLLAYVGYNVVYAAAATPAGSLSDRLGRRAVLTGGFLLFAAVYAGLAVAPAAWLVWPLFGLYGVYAAVADGVVRAQVADLADPRGRGTALGTAHALTGILSLVASVVAGFLWSRLGAPAPFLYGSAWALAAAVLLATGGRRTSARRREDGGADGT